MAEQLRKSKSIIKKKIPPNNKQKAVNIIKEEKILVKNGPAKKTTLISAVPPVKTVVPPVKTSAITPVKTVVPVIKITAVSPVKTMTATPSKTAIPPYKTGTTVVPPVKTFTAPKVRFKRVVSVLTFDKKTGNNISKSTSVISGPNQN